MGDDLNNKRWQDMSYGELSKIEDKKLRHEYQLKMTYAIRYIINPLYMYAVKNGFDDTNFSKLSTVSEMSIELKKFYDKKGISREEEIDIIVNKRWKI